MSEENVEIVRGAFAAFERGDLNRVLGVMADDMVTHRVEPENALYHGKEGFFRATADWTEDFDDWVATAEDYVSAEDLVLVRVKQTARGKTSGVPVESHFWFVFEMRDRKIARLTFHSSEQRAFEAAGLRTG